MNRPIVSTITPCFNMAKYLDLFLKKLPCQTFFDQLEVILDHNAPTEEELHLISDFQKKFPGHLKHIHIDHVDPIGVSMNRCIENAAGDFLTIWNVDDLRTPDSIESQVKVLQNNPDVSIVHGPYRIVGKFGSETGILVDNSQLPESELTRGMIIGPFFMFRRTLCEKAGVFDEQLRSGADFDFAVRLALHGKAASTKNELGYYLNEGLGASTKPNSYQPIECTVIEFRYGIYDKINYDLLPQSLKYNILNVLQNQEWIPINRFIPDFDNFIDNRFKKWFLTGIKKYLDNKVFIEPIKWIIFNIKQIITKTKTNIRILFRNKNDK